MYCCLCLFQSVSHKLSVSFDQLTVDLNSYGISVAVVTETHFSRKHSDSVTGVDGFTVFRRDREGRRGGGVAVYVRSTTQSTVWSLPNDNRLFDYCGCRQAEIFSSEPFTTRRGCIGLKN